MNMLQKTLLVATLIFGVAAQSVHAHLIGQDENDHSPPHYDFSVHPPTVAASDMPRMQMMAQALGSSSSTNRVRVGNRMVRTNKPIQAEPFDAFDPKVKTHWDEQFLYVEGNGLPAHNMMVGITAWQQQVPLPQAYTGNNAWRIPLSPVPSKNPVSIKGRFLRGAIALAANGIPIFNPQNNRGEVSQEIGELDQWGGHCGRADDYHYHAAPFHLQSVLGKNLPLAYALDGYAIYGLTEPDGSPVGKLDMFNGHTEASGGYHYHGSMKYPYVNGGFHGEVVERDGQVDPQPRAQGVREALQALRGAKITGFTSRDNQTYSLKYVVGSETSYVNYIVNADGTVKFDFVDGRGQVKTTTYSPRQGGGGGGGERPPGDRKGKGGQKKGPGGQR